MNKQISCQPCYYPLCQPQLTSLKHMPSTSLYSGVLRHLHSPSHSSPYPPILHPAFSRGFGTQKLYIVQNRAWLLKGHPTLITSAKNPQDAPKEINVTAPIRSN